MMVCAPDQSEDWGLKVVNTLQGCKCRCWWSVLAGQGLGRLGESLSGISSSGGQGIEAKLMEAVRSDHKTGVYCGFFSPYR